MRTLTEYGRGDLALQIAANDTYPSWGYMVHNGATTIWELWNGNTADPAMNSGNHVMLLGDLILWEYEYLGGIRALEPGYKKIQLKPYPIDGLDFCELRIQLRQTVASRATGNAMEIILNGRL
jgi:Bacterial alpha-L-rhamnosidase.